MNREGIARGMLFSASGAICLVRKRWSTKEACVQSPRNSDFVTSVLGSEQACRTAVGETIPDRERSSVTALSCRSHGYNMLRCGFLEADIGAKRSILRLRTAAVRDKAAI